MDLSWWRVQAAALLPLPMLLVAVLSTPAPRQARRRVLWFTEKVLGWEVRPPFQVQHAALIVTAASVLSCLPVMMRAQEEVAAAHGRPGVDANTLVLLMTEKFRRERNFWLSLYTFTAWLVLHIVYRVNREKHELRGRLLALQGCASEAAHEVAFLGEQAQQAEREIHSQLQRSASRGGGPAGKTCLSHLGGGLAGLEQKQAAEPVPAARAVDGAKAALPLAGNGWAGKKEE